jgi:putative ABC transport system permease protein
MTPPAAARAPNTLRLATRFARRELRGGLRGFWIFIACIALGVAAIAAVGSVAHAMRDTIAGQGREILGGDISFSLIQRQASDEERTWIAGLGTISEVATLRALAKRDSPPGSAATNAGNAGAEDDDATATQLVEVKTVDPAYPLYGTVDAQRSASGVSSSAANAFPDWHAALAKQPDGTYGALMERSLSDRLGVTVGDHIGLGLARLTLTGILNTEPDKISAGVGFGPRLMLGPEALAETGLVQPGSLVRWTYRVRLPADDAAASRLDAIKLEAGKRFPEAGWEIRTRTDASPGLVANIENFASFLTLVGLTALIVGGVGVANAVKSFVDMKRDVIAIFKCLGASGDLVFLIYAIQVLFVTLIGVGAGLIVGVALADTAAWFLKDLLPIGSSVSIYPSDLALAAIYGVLTAMSFALWPLGRTHDMQPSALFRDGVAPSRVWPRLRYTIATAVIGLTLVALAIILAPDRRLAAGYLAAFAGIFVVLRLVSAGIGWIARHAPRPPLPELRLALANLHRPGAATVSVMLSLGLGLTLLVSLSLIDANLRGQLDAQLPKTVPSFFFLDISPDNLVPFSGAIAKSAPNATFDSVPMLRGRIVAVKGVPADELKVPPRSTFILQGDRGMTYAATVPKNSTLTQGSWWPANYNGPPLVSLEDDLGHDLGLHIGDRMTVNVLGRDLDVTIGNFRKVAWSTFGINFFMVFSPNTFAGAPIGDLATVAFPSGTPDATEYALLNSITRAFPTITAIRVKDQLKSVSDLIGKLATGVAAAASVTIVTAILVLAGAFAASQERRIYVAVILKTLGATRARILTALTLEFVVLGLVAAIVALAAGSVAAWVVIAQVMKLSFRMSLGVAVEALLAAVVITLVMGLANTAVALGRKAAPILRNR